MLKIEQNIIFYKKGTCNQIKLTETNLKLQFSIQITLGLMLGTRMLLIPPSFTLILRQRLERVCGDVLFTFLACTH